SGGASAASTRGGRTWLIAPASEAVTRNRRCVHIIFTEVLRSRLQLALELVEEAPIGALGDDLLRARLYQPGFVQAQRIKPQRVLVIVFAPFVVRNLRECLEGIVVARREAAIDDALRRPGRLVGAQIGGLEDRPQYPLGCDRMVADELPVARQHAAEILRPRPIHRAVDDDV